MMESSVPPGRTPASIRSIPVRRCDDRDPGGSQPVSSRNSWLTILWRPVPESPRPAGAWFDS